MEALPAAQRRSYRRPFPLRGETLLLLAPCIGYLILFSLFPLLYTVVLSFLQYRPETNDFRFIGVANFTELFTDPVFWTASRNSALFTGSAVAAEVLAGTALALFFNLRLHGATFVRGIVILPMLLTPLVLGLMWRALLNPSWGLVNYGLQKLGLPPMLWLGDPRMALWVLVLVDVWQWTPFVFVVVFARLQALPEEVFEAGRVDGANSLAMLRHLTLPLLAPAIAFAGVFRALDAFRTFDLVFGLTYGGPGRSSTTISFYVFQSAFTNSRLGYASAMSWVMVLAAILGTTLLFRFVSLRRADAT